eukprot:CAMPEP_0172892186 /NCGR_PEP_ID=MMETSP1075-20121228/145641_1 /TAXON_ID=2916 /ORGANISM="Ceratium fusus, Strain PA161109" /LENGTH=49 /DNA_ID=CAMNT_0013746781 /DNA_START=856 /DNA_END=1005 /DNA_ORIENTATION=-
MALHLPLLIVDLKNQAPAGGNVSLFHAKIGTADRGCNSPNLGTANKLCG